MRRFLMAAVLFVLGAATQPLAHHSIAAQFDGSKPVTLVGAITRVEWRNPHIWIYLDVKNPDKAKVRSRFDAVHAAYRRSLLQPAETIRELEDAIGEAESRGRE